MFSPRPLILGAILLPCTLWSQAPGAPAPTAPVKAKEELKWDSMDLGPFHSGTFKLRDQVTAKGVAIKVGTPEQPATVLFDTELLRVSAAWTGDFLRFPRGRGGLEGQISSGEGKITYSTAQAPGWSPAEIGEDPRERHQGRLPDAVAKWRGLYLHGDKVVLSYTVGGVPVLELPGSEMRGRAPVFTRTIQVGPLAKSVSLLICDLPGATGRAEGNLAVLTGGDAVQPEQTEAAMAGAIGLPAGGRVMLEGNTRVVVTLPPSRQPLTFQVVIWAGMKSLQPAADDFLKKAPLADLVKLTKGGPARWGSPLETAGALGSGDAAYVADEITLPVENRFNSWFRPGGHDFFPDGSVALASVSGDVWLVSGLDERLEAIKWKRFATGLFQPLGLKVVDGKVYVLGRDQITRLHDSNKDGEADYYECFNNDCVVTENYHEFAMDLQRDAAGDFYYAKGSPWQPTVTSPHQGCMLRVSKDGSKMDIVATGLRAPNGLGMGPSGELSVSDNQGHWMPANRLNLVKQGGFYGMVTAAHKPLTFRTGEEEWKGNPSDPKLQAERKQNFWGSSQTPIPVEGQDPPLCWIPMQIDNSPGGQVWVPPGTRWGPLGGQMLHLSYGKCTLFNVLQERVGDVHQGGLVKFPIKFPSGIMRGHFSPVDGQLYVSGLRVWQSDASKDGCLTRVRYTGKTVNMPLRLSATAGGMQITFTNPLDAQTAADTQNYSVEQWNYAWTGSYGSPDFSVADPSKKSRDLVLISSATLSPDGKTVTLALPDRKPVMQMKIRYKITAADGQVLDQEIYSTVNQIPATTAATR